MKNKYTYLIIIFLTVASFAAFGRIAGNDFINFDDNIYIVGNNHIKSGITPESIKWAFGSFVSKNWHPLTWISLMLDYRLFGANPGGYHLVSLLLHIGSVLLLFLFLNKTTKSPWSAAFAASLFALHPLRVESVVWAAERKDVLSMFFGMAALYAYAFYAQSLKVSRYFICLMLFIMSLLSKSMLVTLPFILLLLDYWPLGRWQKALEDKTLMGRLLWEKVPFLFLTISSSIMTIWAQYEVGEIRPNISMRFINAIISYVAYLKKLFSPVDLAVFYPFEYSFPLWQILGACLILLVITIFVIYLIKKMPFLFVGWFWYLGTLVPVIGLVPVNAPIADRYTYLSSIGTAIMLAWGVPLLFPRADIRKKILLPVAIAILVVLSFITYRQCGYWRDSITLLSHTLRVTKDNYLAHNNRGVTYLTLGQYQLAIEDFNEAIHLAPNYDIAYNNRGLAYDELGQYHLAIKNFDEAIRLKPDYADAYKNREITYAKMGKRQPAEKAVDHYNEVIQLKPNSASAHAYVDRGNAYNELGRYQDAIADYNEAVRLKPDYADAYYNKGTVYARYGQYNLAIKDLNKAISLKNNFAKAYNNRGLIFARLNQYQNAIINFNEAIRLDPRLTECYLNRSKLYFIQGNNPLGCRDAQKACELGECKLLEWFKNKGLCH